MTVAEPSLPGRRIAHVDMDAFYASVELLRRPDLADLPVAIGGRGDPRSRGVVTTANYPARAFGIRSGMPLTQALRLCPDCHFLPVDFVAYRAASARFKAAIATVTDRIEDRGIDEVYVDLGGLAGSPLDLGRRLKSVIRDATALTCSVGIADNKLLAKIASDLDKPDGLTWIGPGDLEARIWPLPTGRINGIGPKAVERLGAMKIETIGDLAGADPVRLQRHFGRDHALWLIAAAHGRDDRPLSYDSEPRSRSRETTFDRDLVWGRHDDEIREVIGELSTQLAGDLQRGRYSARTIGLKLRFGDFSLLTRDLTLAHPTDAALEIEQAALVCLARAHKVRGPGAVTGRILIRLIGVKASTLTPRSELQPQLF